MEQTEEQVATAEVVASEPRVIEPAKPAGQVVTQAAAVAATTFVAGAGLAAVLRGRRARGGILRPPPAPQRPLDRRDALVPGRRAPARPAPLEASASTVLARCGVSASSRRAAA